MSGPLHYGQQVRYNVYVSEQTYRPALIFEHRAANPTGVNTKKPGPDSGE